MGHVAIFVYKMQCPLGLEFGISDWNPRMSSWTGHGSRPAHLFGSHVESVEMRSGCHLVLWLEDWFAKVFFIRTGPYTCSSQVLAFILRHVFRVTQQYAACQTLQTPVTVKEREVVVYSFQREPIIILVFYYHTIPWDDLHTIQRQLRLSDSQCWGGECLCAAIVLFYTAKRLTFFSPYLRPAPPRKSLW